MKIRNIKDGAIKKAAKTGKVVELKKVLKEKEERASKLKKLQEARAIARRMGLDTRNVALTELVRAIQRAEGYSDCYLSGRDQACGQTDCLWRDHCAPC